MRDDEKGACMGQRKRGGRVPAAVCLVLSGDIAACFSMSRTPDLEGRLLFPHQPLFHAQNLLLAAADSPLAGIGFDVEAASRVFEPFRRLHGGGFTGHGVGLGIVKRIVERHGGRVWADARQGEGATFMFTLAERAPGG